MNVLYSSRTFMALVSALKSLIPVAFSNTGSAFMTHLNSVIILFHPFFVNNIPALFLKYDNRDMTLDC